MATSNTQRGKKEIKAEIKALKKEKRGTKKEKNPMLLEARKVLLNQVELDIDGKFVTTTEARFPLWGAADGEDKIRMYGVSNRTYYYDSDLNDKKAVFRAGKAMANIGRGINLRSNRDAVACLVKTYIFYPTVLIFYEGENDAGEDQLCLTAYTPRTFTSALAIKLAISKFDKSAGDDLDRLGKKAGLIDRIKENYYKKKYGSLEEEEDEDYEIELEDADEDDFIEEPEEDTEETDEMDSDEDSEEDYEGLEDEGEEESEEDDDESDEDDE